MELDKAIEILNIIAADIDVGESDDDIDALQLGIEALRRIKRLREDKRVSFVLYLSGETKD